LAVERIRSTVPRKPLGWAPGTRWHLERCGGCPCIVAQGFVPYGEDSRRYPPTRYIADAGGVAEARWIALFDPVVGLLLADWLDKTALVFDTPPVVLALVRAINGAQS
jgi:hypothetical protein